MSAVQTGLDRLIHQEASRVRGKRVVLLAHQASISSRFRHAADELQGVGADLLRILAPEHGLYSSAQDMEEVSHEGQRFHGVPLFSLYGDHFESLWPKPEWLADAELLVVDLQDVGTRFYTYATTMIFCMEQAAKAGVPVLVLDRPNPINGLDLEGTILQKSYRSFVGWLELPIRHGLTLGELALLANEEEHLGATLEVLSMEGWTRSMWFDETGLPWVQPSPNMPTLDTATVYPGGCLLEGTTLSEGRGTTRPFELLGAPGVEDQTLAEIMNARQIPGVTFRPTGFTPMFQKHQAKLCLGVQVHVTDRRLFRSVHVYLELIRQISKNWPDAFGWRTETYEFVSDPKAMDLLLAHEELIRFVMNGQDDYLDLDIDETTRFATRRKPYLLYD